jgi:hypothetical protein
MRMMTFTGVSQTTVFTHLRCGRDSIQLNILNWMSQSSASSITDRHGSYKESEYEFEVIKSEKLTFDFNHRNLIN